jgi:hypothetical protein
MIVSLIVISQESPQTLTQFLLSEKQKTATWPDSSASSRCHHGDWNAAFMRQRLETEKAAGLGTSTRPAA